MSKHLGEIIPIKVGLYNSIGQPITSGVTTVAIVTRDVDDQYWTGSAWQVAEATLAMAHVRDGVWRVNLDTGHASFGTPISLTIVVKTIGTAIDTPYIPSSMNFSLDEDYESRVVVDAIKVVTDILNIKLPTNFIMGSSSGANLDGTINSINSKTNLIDDNHNWLDRYMKYGIVGHVGVFVAWGSETASKFRLDDALAGGIDGNLDDISLTEATGYYVGQRVLWGSSENEYFESTIVKDVLGGGGTYREITVYPAFPRVPASGSWCFIKNNPNFDMASARAEVVSDGGNTANTFKTDLTETSDDFWQGMLLRFTSGANAGQTRRISAYNGTTKFITLSSSLVATPAAGDTFEILAIFAAAGSALTEASITDAVWDEALSGHIAAGSMGEAQNRLDDVQAKTDLLPADPASEAAVIAEIDANEVKIDNVSAQVSTIQNNVSFSATVRKTYERPATGSVIRKILVSILDSNNNHEDPDDWDPGNPGPDVAIKLTGGTSGVLFDQWMTKIAVGRYEYDMTIYDNDILEDWYFEFHYKEGGVDQFRDRVSKLSEYESDLNEVQAGVNAIFTKVKASDLAETIPDQIDRIQGELETYITAEHDATDALITALQTDFDEFQSGINIKSSYHKKLYRPQAKSLLTQNLLIGDITKAYASGTLEFRDERAWMRIAGGEIIRYNSKDDAGFISLVRGEFGTTEINHIAGSRTLIEQVYVYPIKISIFDKNGDPVTPTSAEISVQPENSAPSYVNMTVEENPHEFVYYITVVPDSNLELMEIHIRVIANDENVDVVKTCEIVPEPATLANQTGNLSGEYAADENGWYDGDGILNEWPIEMRGKILDSLGSPEDDVQIIFYLYNPLTEAISKNDPTPPLKALSEEDGSWDGMIGPGDYAVFFYKDGREAKGPVIVAIS